MIRNWIEQNCPIWIIKVTLRHISINNVWYILLLVTHIYPVTKYTHSCFTYQHSTVKLIYYILISCALNHAYIKEQIRLHTKRFIHEHGPHWKDLFICYHTIHNILEMWHEFSVFNRDLWVVFRLTHFFHVFSWPRFCRKELFCQNGHDFLEVTNLHYTIKVIYYKTTYGALNQNNYVWCATMTLNDRPIVSWWSVNAIESVPVTIAIYTISQKQPSYPNMVFSEHKLRGNFISSLRGILVLSHTVLLTTYLIRYSFSTISFHKVHLG